MSDPTEDREAQRTSERPRPISAPPPDFDDGPGGETKQTPKEELARWRRMAARGADRPVAAEIPAGEAGYETLLDREATREALRASERPAAPSSEVTRSSEVLGARRSPRISAPPIAPPPSTLPLGPRIEPPTRELELASDMVALTRREGREPTGPTAMSPNPKAPPSQPTLPSISLPPRAQPPRPALRPIAGSTPPDVPVLPTPAIGVSLPPGVAVTNPPRSRSSRPMWIAAGVIALALVGAAALLLWPREDPFATSPEVRASTATPSAAIAPTPTAPIAAPTAPIAAPTAPIAAPTAPIAAPTAPMPTTPTAPMAAPTTPMAAPTPTTPVAAPTAAITPVAPSAPVAEAEASSETLKAQGEAALEARDYALALSLYQQAIALDGHDPYAFAGAARACLGLSRPADAVRFAERAVANRQRRAMFRVLLGDAHRANGSMERAREAWSRALELDPEDEEARARLAE